MKPKKWAVPQYRCKYVRERTVRYPAPAGASDEPPRYASSSREAAAILHAMLDDADREKLVVIYLDGRNGVTGTEVVAIGGLHGCGVEVRDVLRGAILARASAIILGHNHPSGDPSPSDEDIALTKQLYAAAKLMAITVHDHVIVCANGRHCSFDDRGIMDPIRGGA